MILYMRNQENAMNNRITINPDICHGKPTIRDSRLLVTTILELLAGGAPWSELLEEYPSLEVDDIRACLDYADLLLVDQDREEETVDFFEAIDEVIARKENV